MEIRYNKFHTWVGQNYIKFSRTFYVLKISYFNYLTYFFCIVATLSCHSLTAYVCLSMCLSSWRLFGKHSTVILKCTPVRQPTDYIICPTPITKSLRHWTLIKKTHWMRYHQDLTRHDWNPSLLLLEINLRAVPESKKEKKKQLCWISLQLDIFVLFYNVLLIVVVLFF